ncbi:MAG: sugar phosphate isomerase/epimerase family protein [Verrucomicrobiota bacterium]
MNRRSFLKAGTASLVMAGPLATLQAAPTSRRIRKGIMWGTVGVKGSVMEKMQAIKEAGFEGVEPMGGMNQDEVVKALEATGMKAGSVCCHTHWAKPLSDPNPAVREAGLEGLRISLRDAKRYGAPAVLLVPAVVNSQITYADAYRRSQEQIKKVVPLAEDLGVRIAIENVWNNFLLSPLEAARYVDELQSPSVGWHLDCGNIIHYGWAQHWVQALGKRIATLHIKEYSRSKADKQGKWAGFDAEFLKGDNEWPAIMKALDDIGYDGWGIAEQPGAGSPEGLQKLSKEMDQIFAL